MLPAERRKLILEDVLANGVRDTESLARRFGVSAMTIRRDLRRLEADQAVRTTRGGAAAPAFLAPAVAGQGVRADRQEAKRAIAALALEMVPDHSCVVLDAGTTTLELARLLLPRTLTVVTADLRIALILCASSSLSVYTTGGQVDTATKTHAEADALEFLRSLRPTLAFIGTSAWDARHGVTATTQGRQRLKRQMLNSAQQAVLLADSGKYGLVCPWCVGELAEFACIITDSELPAAQGDLVTRTGATLKTA